MTKFGIRPEAAPAFARLLRAITETTPCVVDPEEYAGTQDERHHVWAACDRSRREEAEKSSAQRSEPPHLWRSSLPEKSHHSPDKELTEP